MARHARRALISPVWRHWLLTAFVGLGSLGGFASAWSNRQDRDSTLLWAGWGIFALAVTVIVGSLSLGPRPLGSFGVGAWLLLMASGASTVWLGRAAIDLTTRRGPLFAPMMLLLSIGLVPLALWMMIWRPLQSWERELQSQSADREQPPPRG